MKSLNDFKKNPMVVAFLKSELYIKYRIVLVPTIVLILSLTIAILVTVPQVIKLFQTYQVINDLNSKNIFYEDKITKLKKTDINTYKKNLDTALVALPVEKDIPGILGQLLVAVSSSGLSLEGISFSGASADSGVVSEYSIKMELKGTEIGLHNFLERIKVTPRLMKLNAIDLSKNENSDDLFASVSFVTLYQPLPDSIGSVEQPLASITTEDMQVLSDIQAKINSFPKLNAGSAPGGSVGKLDPFAK